MGVDVMLILVVGDNVIFWLLFVVVINLMF